MPAYGMLEDTIMLLTCTRRSCDLILKSYDCHGKVM